MKKQLFTGAATAMVTPFREDASIDFDAMKKLIDFQIEGGIDALVVCGSTGESATLSAKEKLSVFIKAVEYVDGRVPVIAGTGSNDTQASIALSLVAKEHGANGVLLVAPYYNKPSQEGLYYHYKTIAEAVEMPCIIYNVPSRAGINILPETQLKLAEDCEHVVATKEASGDLEQIMKITKYAPKGFLVYSGDDALTLPVMSVGGSGVISVISNYLPKEFGDSVKYALKGKWDKAKKAHFELLELMGLNFIETNPVPVKTALSLMGMMEPHLRMPLVPMMEENKEKLAKAMKKMKLI